MVPAFTAKRFTVNRQTKRKSASETKNSHGEESEPAGQLSWGAVSAAIAKRRSR